MRPEYFNREYKINGYTFFMNKHGLVYVPENKKDFETFLKILFDNTKNPTSEQKENYELILEYPFLLPKNRWDRGLQITSDFAFDFSWTEIDAMPKGWFKAFGKQMLEELKRFIVEKRPGFLYEYTITDIKEKYGSLRWYDNGTLEGMYNIINKYEELSLSTCIICGKEGTIDNSECWITPLCKYHRKNK
jgi:hypothetical protein